MAPTATSKNLVSPGQPPRHMPPSPGQNQQHQHHNGGSHHGSNNNVGGGGGGGGGMEDLRLTSPSFVPSHSFPGGGDGVISPVATQRPVPAIVEEFRSDKTRKFTLWDFRGHLVEFSRDQHGSRFIQQQLETATTEEKQMVLDEVLPSILQLMSDVFGNYLCQKLFEFGTPAQVATLGRKLQGNVLALSLQMYGCRVVQKAIESIDNELQVLLLQELEGHILRCVKDQNANHVIQKCIEKIPPSRTKYSPPLLSLPLLFSYCCCCCCCQDDCGCLSRASVWTRHASLRLQSCPAHFGALPHWYLLLLLLLLFLFFIFLCVICDMMCV